MDKNNLKIHQDIEESLLSVMSEFDFLLGKLMLLHRENYSYAAGHLNKISDMKSDCKEILNKDFDKLAVKRGLK